ncbi:MAG: hypothetical protein ACLGG9_06575 [Thermoleophilia bacterium]
MFRFQNRARARWALALITVFTVIAVAAGCGGGSADAEPQDASQATGSLVTVDGRAVSATDQELVLRTADGERTFQIREDDLQAVDPAHFESHVGVATLGFRIHYVSEGGIDYAVSTEEIKGSTLGFD